MDPALTYEKRGHIAYITLNRSDVRNALNPELMVRLSEAWVDYAQDDNLRVAIITGAGDVAFSSGADLGRLIPLFTGARQPEDEWDRRLMGNLSLARTALLRGYPLYKPIISAINGYCLAAGTELIQATDIRIAADHATFALSEVKRGIIPAGGGLARLPRQIPYCKAMEILLVGDSITAQEAHDIGLVNYVVPLAEVMPKAEEIAAKIAANGPLAVRKAKEAVVRSSGLPLEDAYKAEDLYIMEVMRSEDAREGPRAFKEKREPQYKGR
jgi:enoyl-CoA hydratase